MSKKSFITMEVKSATTDEHKNGSFEATLSDETLDRDGEIVDSYAFEPLPDSIPIYTDHDAGNLKSIVGRATPSYNDDGKLVLKGFYASTDWAQDVRKLVNEKVVTSMSVGFGNATRQAKGGVPHVTKAETYEGSFVGVPANVNALVTNSKRYGDIEPPVGSFEAVQEDILETLTGYYSGETYICLIATYFDHVVYSVNTYPTTDQDGTYSVNYTRTLSEDGTDGEVTMDGDPQSVEVLQVVSAKAAAHNEQKVAEWKAMTELNAKADAGANEPDAELATVLAETTAAEAELDDFDVAVAEELIAEFDDPEPETEDESEFANLNALIAGDFDE